MKSVIYALIGVSSLVTVLQVNQVNLFNINIQVPSSQQANSAQPSPAPMSSCGSEYECQRIENIKKLAEDGEKQCVKVKRESSLEQGKLVKDTIETRSEAVKMQETIWRCEKN